MLHVKLRGMLYYCDCPVLNVLPRYKILVEVVDGIHAAVFVIFDRDAEILLQRSCASLINNSDKVCKDSGNPELFNALLGKMLFKVEVRPPVLSNSNSDGSFRVRRVCNDKNIISMFLLDGGSVTPEKEFVAALVGSQMPSTSDLVIDLTISMPAKRSLSQAFDEEEVTRLGFELKAQKIEKE